MLFQTDLAEDSHHVRSDMDARADAGEIGGLFKSMNGKTRVQQEGGHHSTSKARADDGNVDRIDVFRGENPCACCKLICLHTNASYDGESAAIRRLS